MRGGRGDTRASGHMIKIMNRGIRDEIRSDFHVCSKDVRCWMLVHQEEIKSIQNQIKIKSKSNQNQIKI